MRHSLYALCAPVLLTLALYAVSCTQSKLDLINSIVCPVFSYGAENAVPSFHLCAYVRTSTEPGYLKLLQLESESTGCKWTVSDFQYVYSSNGKWAGSSSLSVPRRLPLPNGLVKLTAVNADSQTIERTHNLSYPKNLLTLDYKGFLSSEDYQKLSQQYIVFYDADGVLLGCALQKDVADADEYAKGMQNAAATRTLWFAKDKSFAVLSPPRALVEKAQKK